MKFEWKNEYSMGHVSIDDAHQRLFALANEIIDSPTNGRLINDTMRLYRHIREHFNDEEKLMRKQAYPDYELHLDAHNQMLDSLIVKSDVIREGNWNKTQVIEFMAQWISHITSSDRQFKDYLASRNPSLQN